MDTGGKVVEDGGSSPVFNEERISQKGGEKVKKAGYWSSPAKPDTRLGNTPISN